VLVSYILSGDQPIVFTVTRREGLRAQRLPKLPELATLIESYREALMSPDAWANPETPAFRKAPALGALLTPIAAQLGGKAPLESSRPTARSRCWPFETLMFDGSRRSSSHDLSYIQSLSMLGLLGSARRRLQILQGRKTLFAMGGAL